MQPPYPDVFLSYADMSYPEDLELKFLEDPKIVELSTTPGRIKWAIPYAAPVLVQMIREGWEPVINVNMIFEHDNESEQAARMRTLVGSSGLIAQRDGSTTTRTRRCVCCRPSTARSTTSRTRRRSRTGGRSSPT